MKATEFDAKFDHGEDITKFLDLSQAKRPGHEHKYIVLQVEPENSVPR